MSQFLLEPLACAATALYVAAVALLAAYGFHSLWLLTRFLRHRRTARTEPLCSDEPSVLVQLPVFNERDVVARLVEAVGAFDWPRDRLRIQLLDDSTDDSAARGAAAIEALRERGLEAAHVRRADRTGFKAGALAHGLALDATHPAGAAEYIAIFDADFVPRADFLRRALPTLLADPRCAFVQGRWEHLNASHSLLTRAQALGIDGHFAIEQGARAWSGLALNFNGTCGVWRRAAIADSGGWQHDTLTEDLDLSYRAQLRGWRGAYDLELSVPGELPPTLEAWRAQQFRWAKGSLQTARKLASSIARAEWPRLTRIAALAHLTHYLVHPLMLLSLALAPAAIPVLSRAPQGVMWIGGALLAFGIFPPLLLYFASQLVLGRGLGHLRALPVLTALGTGIAVSNSRAAWEALRAVASEFERTPKHGDGRGSYRAAPASGLPELAAACWGGIGIAVAWSGSSPWIAPLLALYVLGFAHHGLRLHLQRLREATASAGSARPDGWPLLPLGVASLACMALMAARDASWREEPWIFSLAALALGATFLAGLWVVRTRPVSFRGLLWILAVGAGLNLLGTGLWHSDDVNRYVVEGQQLLVGQNPYAVPPADPSVAALAPGDILAHVNHPGMTAIYPPLTLGVEAAIQALAPGLASVTVFACAGALAAIVLALALLVRLGAAPGLVLAVAWNPVLAIFVSGEAHNDVLMALLLLAALYLASLGKSVSALVAATLAVLAKPFAAVVLPALLVSTSPRKWWLVPALLVLAYLPFGDAGAGLFSSLATVGASMHFHGALEPALRAVTALALAPHYVDSCVRAVLGSCLAGGLVWLWLRRGSAPLPTLSMRALAWLLLCLPTLHPWYFTALVVLLPFARSWSLAIWTASAGVYWLHGVQMRELGSWTETPLVTAAAHVPAMLVMCVEAFGPLREPREPGRLPFTSASVHA